MIIYCISASHVREARLATTAESQREIRKQIFIHPPPVLPAHHMLANESKDERGSCEFYCKLCTGRHTAMELSLHNRASAVYVLLF